MSIVGDFSNMHENNRYMRLEGRVDNSSSIKKTKKPYVVCTFSKSAFRPVGISYAYSPDQAVSQYFFRNSKNETEARVDLSRLGDLSNYAFELPELEYEGKVSEDEMRYFLEHAVAYELSQRDPKKDSRDKYFYLSISRGILQQLPAIVKGKIQKK